MRIGLAGAGPWARQTHAPALAAHPAVDFAGVWARGRGNADAFGVRVFDQFGDLLEHVDAVAFAVPPRVQAELAVVAARAGRHLILEKPLADSVERATQVAEAVAAARVTSVMVLTRRFAPETREFLRRARQGEWSGASAVWLSGALLGGAYATSQWRRELGALSDIGPHLIDLVEAALGPVVGVRSAHVEAGTGTWTVGLRHARPGALGTTDLHPAELASAHEELASTLTMSQYTPVTPTLTRLTLHGRSGVAELEGRATGPVDCYRVLLEEFLGAVAAGAEHPCSARHGLHLLRVAEQARRLAAT